jgi:hypothetical protein
MLFDLRSRGRRRTVQTIYLGLALLMLGGLVLFGVGASSGGGGLLNAFTNNGSGSGSAQVDQQTKAALKVVNRNPGSSAAWAQLVTARWSDAGQGSNFNTSTSTFTASGRKQLTLLTQDWKRYAQLTKSPSGDVAILAAKAYGQLGQYAGEASAWQNFVLANPTAVNGYECWAASAYAAKQTRIGDLAAAKAVTLVPKVQRLTVKQILGQAKTSPAVAQQC